MQIKSIFLIFYIIQAWSTKGDSASSQCKSYEEKSVNTTSSQPSYYTYQTYEPSKTVIKTTIDSKSYVKNNEAPLYQYYNVVSEKSLPKLTQKSVNFDMKNNTEYNYQRPLSASYSYNNTNKSSYQPTYAYNQATCKSNRYNYSVAEPSYTSCQASSLKTDSHYQPVEATFKGKLYAKNNEIHYVSDKANRSWATSKAPQVRIVNAGTTVIHE